MTYVGLRVLEFRPNRIRFAQEFMEIFRFFISISPILLILRISTGQRFRKEWSVQDLCTGSILEGIERLNVIQTASDLHKNSWRYSGFYFHFADFADFEDLNWGSGSRRNGLFMKLVWDALWRASRV